jgi:hypothetical protein
MKQTDQDSLSNAFIVRENVIACIHRPQYGVSLSEIRLRILKTQVLVSTRLETQILVLVLNNQVLNPSLSEICN